MAANEKTGPGRGLRPWRLGVWAAATAAILAIPLIAMQMTREVAWSPGDFLFAGALIMAVGVAYELAASRGSPLYRAGAGVSLAGAFLLVWISGAVGVIGDEGHPANLLYPALLAAGLIGAALARFRARGLALTLAAMALAQLVIGAVAFGCGWGSEGPGWPWDVLGLNGFFAALWLAAAWLFARAGRA